MARTTRNSPESELKSFFRGFICGGGASAIAKTTFAPLERVKILLQTQHIVDNGSSKQYSGWFRTLMQVHREQGLVSLWRGNLTNCARIMPTYALRFTLFDHYQKWFKTFAPDANPLPLRLQLASGALTGATGALFSHPLDLLRTRMAAETTHEQSRVQKHILASGREVVAREGFQGLYKGVVVSMLEISPYVMISLGGYNYLKSRLPSDLEGATEVCSKLGVGWLSGLAGSLTCYPIDTVKRSLMLDGSFVSGHKSQYDGKITLCVRSLYQQHGIAGFYRGCLVNAAKSGPAAAMTFVANDLLKKWV